MGCGYAVCAVLALAGIGLLWIAQRQGQQGRMREAWIAGMLGAAFCVGSVALIAPMQRDVARKRERRRREEARPEEPWTWDDTWLAHGGILQSGRRHGRAFVVFGLAAIVMAMPAVLAIRGEMRKGNPAILLALLFPLVGGGMLVVAARDAWRRRKYGVARFVPAAFPIPLGGELAGMIVVDRRVTPAGAGRISLDCWCTTRSHGRRSRTSEQVVAHTEREVAASDWTTSNAESRLFVQLPVRGGAATTMGDLSLEHPIYEWRLRIDAPTPGADFVAEFVLPVFPVAVVAARTAAAMSADPMTPRSDRADIWRAAGIREEPQAGAVLRTALVFPAGQGRRLITMPLIMALIFGGLTVVLWWSPVPGFIAALFGLFALLPALALKALLQGGGERVWIEGNQVCVQRGRGEPRRLAVAEILRFEMGRNVGVGTQQFYRIVARTRPRREGLIPSRADIARMVLGDEAAGQVVAWLEERTTGPR